MSYFRQIKTLVTLDVTLVTFITLTVVTNLLFKNTADYRTFFISLSLVFLMQYIYINKNNKYLALILPISVSIAFMWILFNGLTILINLIFIITSIFINFNVEKLDVNYTEYKTKAKEGAIILTAAAIISLSLEKSISDYLYRFIINYIIVTVVILRESRSYYYKVRKETKNAEKLGNITSIKKFFTNIFFKYFIVIISTIILTTDWFIHKSLNLIGVLNKILDFVISGFLSLITKIVGPLLVVIINSLKKLLGKTSFLQGLEELSKGLDKINKYKETDKYIAATGATTSDKFIWYTTIKIIFLIIIVIFIVNIIQQMKSKNLKNEEYIEYKEKIDKNNRKQNEYKHKNNISRVLKKFLGIDNTIRNKILNTYRDYEKATKKSKIYKSYMTATELKNATKTKIENDNYLNEMTDIYNKAKFSDCEPKKDHLNIVKKAFNNVKKQL